MTRLLTHLRLSDLTPADRRRLVRRSAVPDRTIRDGAGAICDDVAARGDIAVAEYATRFGGGFRKIRADEIDAAMTRSGKTLPALESAAQAIRTYHTTQIPTDQEVETRPGVTVTRRWSPLRRVGAYVPGGKAAYPSTVLMTAVPARVAGVKEVVVVTPVGPDDRIADVVLAACAVAGVTEVWAMGGAQAIAALAYGTDTVAPVQKIVGPGNAWVTAAKLAVFGVCGIDLPAGPSEVLVLADHTSDPTLVAVDLLCQAEHGPDSPAVLVTTDPELGDLVEAELARLLPDLERRDILATALGEHGLVVVADSGADAVRFAQEYAPEHITILTDDPHTDAKQLTAAGSVYVGRWAPESAGDYATGANHVLPTGGLGGAYGPLSVEDFGSWRQEQHLTREGLEAITPTISTLATSEGLTAHRLAATIRLDDRSKR